MSRYFLEVSYKGTNYSGFQVQENAPTIQAEIQKQFALIQRQPVLLTGSSRTDAGVHALQNYFHFDCDDLHPQLVYKLNAMLPGDIAVKRVIAMPDEAHCRFDATSREYEYRIARLKDPFTKETALYYPYQLDTEVMEKAAAYLMGQEDFFAFAKTNSQVKNFRCRIIRSQWYFGEKEMRYEIEANRFLRGMVRMITAVLLKLGRGKMEWKEFELLFNGENKCRFSSPAVGLFLARVNYPEKYFP